EKHEVYNVQVEKGDITEPTLKKDKIVNMHAKKEYNKNLRTIIWQQNKKKKPQDAKEKNVLFDVTISNNTLLDASVEALSNILLDASTETSSNTLLNVLTEILSNILLDASTEASSNTASLQPSLATIQSPLLPINPMAILHMYLEKVNQQCLIKNHPKANMPIYDHLCLLSISWYIQLLLDKQGKMNANFQITQTVWNKDDYTARCI
ncbi:17521_t:CDS:1, partial [Cetraspora pellucida]